MIPDNFDDLDFSLSSPPPPVPAQQNPVMVSPAVIPPVRLGKKQNHHITPTTPPLIPLSELCQLPNTALLRSSVLSTSSPCLTLDDGSRVTPTVRRSGKTRVSQIPDVIQGAETEEDALIRMNEYNSKEDHPYTFVSSKSLSAKRRDLLAKLLLYYQAAQPNRDWIETCILPLIQSSSSSSSSTSPSPQPSQQQEELSMRVINFGVTNYAEVHGSRLYWPAVGVFEISQSYRMNLNHFSKRDFDPFRRGERILVPFGTSPMRKWFHTTVGQLNFFHWAIQFDILEFCRRHHAEIKKAMQRHKRESMEFKNQVSKDNHHGPTKIHKKKRKRPHVKHDKSGQSFVFHVHVQV